MHVNGVAVMYTHCQDVFAQRIFDCVRLLQLIPDKILCGGIKLVFSGAVLRVPDVNFDGCLLSEAVISLLFIDRF